MNSKEGNGTPSAIDKNFSIYYNDYVGEGAYGIIYKGYSKKDNKIVAIKKLKNEARDQWIKNPAIKREVEVMAKLNHENVLHFYEAVENSSGVFIITEFCNGGDLKRVAAQAKSRQKKTGQEDPTRSGLSQIEVFRYFYEIVMGMAEVNRQGFLHRDLKPENIMLNEHGQIKIADFGLARQIIGTDIYKLEKYSAKGTPIYAAPQVIRGEKFSGLCDVWSCGLLIYELLTGKNYFEKATNMYSLQGLQDKLMQQPLRLPSHFNKIFQETLPLMVSYNEESRACFIELAKALTERQSQIVRSIDPTYKQPANQQTQAPVIAVKQQAYVSDKQTTTNQRMMPTQDMAMMKQVEERNYLLIVEVFRYMDFVYSRGRLMIELMNRLNSTANYPMDSGCKYTIIFLQLGVFAATVNGIISYLKKPVLPIPSGNRIVKEEFDAKSKQNLLRYIDEYCQKVEAEKNNFKITLQQISKKLLSEDYRKRFPALYQRYPMIYEKLQVMINGQEESLEWFESQYRFFFNQECRLQQPKQSLTDEVLRVYWMCVTLSKLREYLPDIQFTDKNIISKVKENFDKTGRAVILQNINNQ